MLRVINPDVEIWRQEGFSIDAIWKHIARCARVCYQSVPKDKNESPYDFVKRTLLRGVDVINVPYTFDDIRGSHLSVLEHGTVHLKYPSFMARAEALFSATLRGNKYSKWNIHKGYIYVTTNMRVIIETNWIDQLEFIDKTPNCPYYYDRTTVNFITNIGVSRELNRHRCHSISEESTRYCSYNKDKFGNNITVTKVPWIDYTTNELNDGDCYEGKLRADFEFINEEHNAIVQQDTICWTAIDWYLYSLSIANITYCKLRELGWSAQQARDVLPLATKTQVVHTAFNDDWKQWIELRADGISGKPHPEIQELAVKLREMNYVD